MKRLIVCFDGTWNNPDQEDNGVPAPTNVFKIHNSLAEADNEGTAQLSYYHPGVGGEDKGPMSAVLGGAIGLGMSRHICSGYHWLAQNYEEGDEIYLYGFSRGAFTVRSLGGMLGRGLLDLNGLSSKEAWGRVHTAYNDGYRVKDAEQSDWAKADWTFYNNGDPTPIYFIGVWDTVGALGVPDDLELLNLFDRPENWAFHDTKLGKNVKHARHAMAIDEIRSSFCVTHWSNIEEHNAQDGSSAIELWFPGVHSDVGGGYGECDLSNGALKWMMEQSAENGLAFREGVIDTIHPNPLGVMHRSYKGAFAALRSRPRNLPAIEPGRHEIFHESSLLRQKYSPIAYPAYRPTKILKPGESITVDVFADTRWNATHVYLVRDGKYTFSADGEWQDSKDTCDWHGTQDSKLTFGDIVRTGGSFVGLFENIYRKITKNKSTDFLFTKRVEHLNWFVMVGAVANDCGAENEVTNDGSPIPHQYVDLTKYENTPLSIDEPGYLYCFPNDVWRLYGNNHGSIQLTIKRQQ